MGVVTFMFGGDFVVVVVVEEVEVKVEDSELVLECVKRMV